MTHAPDELLPPQEGEVSLPEVCDLLGFGERTVLRLITKGDLRAVRRRVVDSPKVTRLHLLESDVRRWAERTRPHAPLPSLEEIRERRAQEWE